MATWPSILGRLQASGYGLEPGQTFIRSDMDAGPARQRARYTAEPTAISLTMNFTQRQMAVFEAWYRHTLDDGTLWFNADIYNGLGSRSAECRFVEVWKATLEAPGVFTVSFRLETRGRQVMTQEELAPFL